MSLQSHLVELEKKHQALEKALHEAQIRPSSDDREVAELKNARSSSSRTRSRACNRPMARPPSTEIVS